MKSNNCQLMLLSGALTVSFAAHAAGVSNKSIVTDDNRVATSSVNKSAVTNEPVKNTDANVYGHVKDAKTGEPLPYVVIQIKGTTEKGSRLPADAKSPIMVVGTSCRLAVFITKNLLISWLGWGFFPFSWSISAMAASPAGVAALPSPNKFAIMLEVMWMRFFVLGKSRRIIGDKSFSQNATAPLSSAIFKMPLQKHIMPAKDKRTVAADAAPESPADSVPCRFPPENAKRKDIIKSAGNM